jgi:hypothetical protein
MMNAAAPEGTPLMRIRTKKFHKRHCPAAPRKGPEAGSHHDNYTNQVLEKTHKKSEVHSVIMKVKSRDEKKSEKTNE